MILISDKKYGIIAAQEVAYAKKKPTWNSAYGRRAGGVNQTRKQIYATVLYCFTCQDDSPCRPGAQ